VKLKNPLFKIAVYHAVFPMVDSSHKELLVTPLPDYLAGRHNTTGLQHGRSHRDFNFKLLTRRQRFGREE